MANGLSQKTTEYALMTTIFHASFASPTGLDRLPGLSGDSGCAQGRHEIKANRRRLLMSPSSSCAKHSKAHSAKSLTGSNHDLGLNVANGPNLPMILDSSPSILECCHCCRLGHDEWAGRGWLMSIPCSKTLIRLDERTHLTTPVVPCQLLSTLEAAVIDCEEEEWEGIQGNFIWRRTWRPGRGPFEDCLTAFGLCYTA